MLNEQQSVKMWSGRFREPLDTEFEAWQRSIVFDWRLLDQEVAASKAHGSALHAAGILSKSETTELRKALDAIAEVDENVPPIRTINHVLKRHGQFDGFRRIHRKEWFFRA